MSLEKCLATGNDTIPTPPHMTASASTSSRGYANILPDYPTPPPLNWEKEDWKKEGGVQATGILSRLEHSCGSVKSKESNDCHHILP